MEPTYKNLRMVLEIHKLLLKHFKDDLELITLWMETKNPMLGYLSPVEMIQADRVDRLLKFVQDARDFREYAKKGKSLIYQH